MIKSNLSSLFLRNEFINFFVEKNHKNISGSSILPANDNSILFTNAGMNQFKDIFLGLTKATDKTATTSQRCIRAGGKHNDLSNVGFTSRHLTCFEMLGNFSFGDYFKEKAIEYAWEFLTQRLKMNKENLWVTVFKNDDEAFAIWKNKIGIAENRIIRLGEKDNFWQMGDVGPCGPCSEIYVDTGIKSEIDKNALPGDDFSTRFLEIWNLVFIQYNRSSNGSLNELSSKGIDTGMGLERLSMIMQNKNSVFETDAFEYIIDIISAQTKEKYENNKGAFRAIADHLRSASCIIAEGVIPSNDGRGYVLRKILRRALLFANKLGNINIVKDSVENFIEGENSLYADLKEHKEFIKSVIADETVKFEQSLIIGTKKFNEMLISSKKDTELKVFSGENAFILYDTYGFPLEITEILAHENSLKIDIDEYERQMSIQRDRSRGNKIEINEKIDLKNLDLKITTEFLGYENDSCNATVKFIIQNNVLVNEAAGKCILIVNKSVIYPGGGGQAKDKGKLKFNEKVYDIINIHKINDAIGIEIDLDQKIKTDDLIDLKIEGEFRKNVTANHTAVHLLQAALRKIYGNYVKQEGSSVTDKEFTFDASLSVLPTQEEIKKIEDEINKNIKAAIPVDIDYMTYDKAISMGVLAFFSEKYNKERVRTVFIGDVSRELCGGTHVSNTKEIGVFFIKNVVTVSSGIKRFIGTSSTEAINELFEFKDIIYAQTKLFKCKQNELLENVNKQLTNFLNLKKEIEKLKEKYLDTIVENWLQNNNKPNGILLLNEIFRGYERYAMDRLQKSRPGIYIIAIDLKQNSNILVEKKIDNIDILFIEEILKRDYGLKGKSTKNSIIGIIEKGLEINKIDFL